VPVYDINVALATVDMRRRMKAYSEAEEVQKIEARSRHVTAASLVAALMNLWRR